MIRRLRFIKDLSVDGVGKKRAQEFSSMESGGPFFENLT